MTPQCACMEMYAMLNPNSIKAMPNTILFTHNFLPLSQVAILILL